jgi:hypothetical protein
MLDLQTATPAEIDAAIYSILERAYRVEASLAAARKRASESRKAAASARAEWKIQREAEAAEAAEAHAEELAVKVASIEAEAAPYNAEFARRGGWTRYYFVSGGHVHADAYCHTLHREGKRTPLGWLPELSDKTMADAIAHYEAQGTGRSVVLCSVCMPDAPTHLFDKPADDSICVGSGTFHYDRHANTTRIGYAAGNGAVCTDCDQWKGVSRTGKLIKHKRPA